jgi:hypothetical protein
MIVAHKWNGARKNFYELGLRESGNEIGNSGNPLFNVYLKEDRDVLRNIYIHSHNDEGAEFCEKDGIPIPVSKGKIELIEKIGGMGNKKVYEWEPPKTWKGFCNFLYENFNLPSGLSGHGIITPELTFVTRPAGTMRKGTVIGYNRNKIVIDSVLVTELDKLWISEVLWGNETVYYPK